MRILHVAPYYERAWAYGGIPRVVGRLCRELAARGHEVTVATTDVSTREARLGGERATVEGDVHVRVFPNRVNRLAYDWQLFTPRGLGAWLERHAATFDVAHLHACHNLPVAIAARHLGRAGVPYVLEPNGTAPRIERRRLAKWAFDATLGRHVLPHAARVIAVSEAERRTLEGLGVPPDAVRLVPNPVDLAEHDAHDAERGREAFRARLGIAPDARVLLYLGKLTPRKRVDRLVDAFAQLCANAAHASVVLVLAGNDMGGVAASLRAQASRLGVSPRVHFVGLVEGAARLDALAAADVVVYAGSDEVFGLVALEALLVGRPVVVGDDSGLAEIVRDVGGGVVVDGADPSAIAAAVERLLGDPAPARARALTAAVRVRERFSASVVVATLEDVYAELASHAVRAGGEVAAAAVPPPGITFVLPVRDGERTLAPALEAVLAQEYDGPREVVVIDDGSGPRTREVLARFADRIRVIEGGGRGVAHALNLGMAAARHPLVAQVDQDVVLAAGWTRHLAEAMADPRMAAAQGWFETDPEASVWARAMGRDLEERYARIRGRVVDHVCTGNTIYRRAALAAVGGFDEALGYGADVDMSYRLRRAGHRLAFCREARSVHHWRPTLGAYVRQQYGFGYGRLDVVARHPRRVLGDDTAHTSMMAHAPALALALLALAAGGVAQATGHAAGRPLITLGAALFALLVLERALAGVRASLRFRYSAALLFPVAHLLRDVAWLGALATWTVRRVLGRGGRPAHSMGGAGRPGE